MPTLIIDFDSTFVAAESLDLLAYCNLKHKKNGVDTIREINNITQLGMNGDISFQQSLQRRIALLDVHKKEFNAVIEQLKKKVSSSIRENKQFFKDNCENIYILSSGFKELIEPIANEYHIHSSHVYANTFRYDNAGAIIGFDSEYLLAKDAGKAELALQLALPKPCVIVGDGFNDFQVYETGAAQYFLAYTEHVHRPKISQLATDTINSFEYVISFYHNISQ